MSREANAEKRRRVNVRKKGEFKVEKRRGGNKGEGQEM